MVQPLPRPALLAALILLAFSARAADVAFSVAPKAVKSSDATLISFTVSGRTDVEVAVLDGQGKLVRHLAAGVLGGEKPPPEPLKPGLAQSLNWDGKDDMGKPVTGGPFKVRVRAGMGVKFGRMLGGSSYTGLLTSGAPSDSIAIDTDGSIFVKMGSFVPQLHEANPWQVRKFDKTGKYVKTVLPYPASTAPAKAPGFKLIDTGDGHLTPANTNPLDVVLFNFGDNLYSHVVDGNLVFIDARNAKLNFIKTDGSNTLKSVPMRSGPEKLKWASWLSPQLAFSADGKYAYYSNVANTPYDGKKPADIDPNFPQGRIYRQDLSKPGADPEKFYDLELPDFAKKPYWMPSAWDKKTASGGIDLDAEGHIFVCDLVNQEVVELSPDGKKLSATKAPWPDKVIVGRKSGALYVVSCEVSRGYTKPATLLKLTGRGDGAKVAAKLPLTGSAGQTMTLDETGAKPVLWLGGGADLIRVEDRGAELAPLGTSIVNPSKDDIAFVCYGDVDVENEDVYITEGMGRIWRYNGETGEGALAPIKACDLAVGTGGLIYTWGDTGSWAGPIARYFRDYKPAPLTATGKHTYGNVYGRFGRGNNAPGMDVDNRGNVYVVCGFNDCNVRVFNDQGNLVDYARKGTEDDNGKKKEVPVFISYVLDQGGSLRVDPQGNVYVLEIGLPKGHVPPKGFEKDAGYSLSSGTIYKFTPKGGEFKKGANGFEAIGAVQSYAGCGPNSGSWNSTQSVCHCTRPRFDVDGYGRVYIPHGFTYNVSIRDNADNEILRFGNYGNFDCAGPKSAEPTPEIPLGWPIFVGASEKYVYIGDGLNHRVVRTDKTFAAEALCEVK